MASKKKQSFTITKTRSNKIQQTIDVQNYPPPSPTEPCATWYSHLDTEVNLLITNAVINLTIQFRRVLCIDIKHDTLEELLEKVASVLRPGHYTLYIEKFTSASRWYRQMISTLLDDGETLTMYQVLIEESIKPLG